MGFRFDPLIIKQAFRGKLTFRNSLATIFSIHVSALFKLLVF